ncbi:MAG TPA: hypothetical protein VN616_18815 [Puia sp.]|nr:hypothetical protein [Puia sp.]
MKSKFLYALGLLLCLSTVASSNDCASLWCRATGKSGPRHDTVKREAARHGSAVPEPAPAQENHVFLHTFIKLLYI